MKTKPFFKIAAGALMAWTIICAAGCKKNNPVNPDKTQKLSITLPDSAMFLGTGSKFGDSTTIYLLNASNGTLAGRFSYPHKKQADSYIPLVGNGLLYVIENTRINALNLNTGAILWSDSVKNATAMHALLHNDTFYGLSSFYLNNMTVFALDATKQSDNFLWQYTLGSNYSNTTTTINYYNGLIYINTTGSLTVLDGKTGGVKWSTINSCSVASLKNGVITSGNNILDASTGTITSTIPSSLVVSNTSQTASILYASQNVYFTQLTQYVFPATVTTINAYDAGTNALKWSINGGGTYTGLDSSKTIDQILNNQPILKAHLGTSGGKYGFSYINTYSALDMATGSKKWTFSAGLTGQNFQVGNTLYSCGTYTLNLAAGQPAASNISAADLTTGKIKWTNNNNLPFAIGGSVAACVSVRGTGYAIDIQ